MARNIISMKGEPPEYAKLIILVDYSNLLYRAYFSSLREVEIRPWLCFERALDMLGTCIKICRRDNQPVEFIFAGDSVRKKLDRMKTDENYKADRPALTDLRFYIFRHIMQRILKDMGFGIVWRDGVEGDDIIASCVDHLVPSCNCSGACLLCACDYKPHPIDVVIFSCDRDLEALLSYKHTRIYRAPKLVYTKQDYIHEYGFSPRYHADYKALVGDKSDNIKPVPMWGPNKAKEQIAKGNWRSLLEKDQKKLDIYEHNLDLIRLRTDIDVGAENCSSINFTDLSEETLRKIQSDFHDRRAIDDIVFAVHRLEEVML